MTTLWPDDPPQDRFYLTDEGPRQLTPEELEAFRRIVNADGTRPFDSEEEADDERTIDSTS